MATIEVKFKKITEPKPSAEQSRVFIKLAQEMHEMNPSIGVVECLRIIIDRHKTNLKGNRR